MAGEPDAKPSNDERTVVVKKIERVLDAFFRVDKATFSHPRFDGGRQTITRLSMERGDSAAGRAGRPEKP